MQETNSFSSDLVCNTSVILSDSLMFTWQLNGNMVEATKMTWEGRRGQARKPWNSRCGWKKGRMMRRERSRSFSIERKTVEQLNDTDVSTVLQLRYSVMGRQPKLKCASYTQHNNREKADRDHWDRQGFGIKWTKCSWSDWYLLRLYCSLNLSSNGCLIDTTENQESRVPWF